MHKNVEIFDKYDLNDKKKTMNINTKNFKNKVTDVILNPLHR